MVASRDIIIHHLNYYGNFWFAVKISKSEWDKKNIRNIHSNEDIKRLHIFDNCQRVTSPWTQITEQELEIQKNNCTVLVRDIRKMY